MKLQHSTHKGKNLTSIVSIVSVISVLVSVLVLSPFAFVAFGQEEVTLKYQNWTINEIPFEEELINEFERQNPNINIEVITKPIDAFDRQLTMAYEANKLPDVFEARPGYTTSLGNKGLMANLDTYLQEDPGYVEQFTQSGLNLGKLDGTQIAVPWRGGAWAVYVNKKIFEENNIEIPDSWTWSEFVSIAEKVTSKNVYGFAMAGDPADYGTAQSWAAHLAMNGGRFFVDGEIAINSEAAVRALSQYKELVEKEVVPPDVESLRYQDIVQLFGRGRVAMWVNGPWFIATVEEAYPDVDLQIAPLPTVSGAKPGSVTSGTTLAMGETTNHPEAVWKFIKFLITRDNLLRWGEAGEFVPPLKDTSGAEYLEEEPLSTFLEMQTLPNTFQVGNLPHAYDILRALGDHIQTVLTGRASPEDALDSAAEEWSNILED